MCYDRKERGHKHTHSFIHSIMVMIEVLDCASKCTQLSCSSLSFSLVVKYSTVLEHFLAWRLAPNRFRAAGEKEMSVCVFNKWCQTVLFLVAFIRVVLFFFVAVYNLCIVHWCLFKDLPRLSEFFSLSSYLLRYQST